MSVDIIKLFRPQTGDIIIVDFNKVNVTQVENAVKDLKVPVIAVHDIQTIQIWGLREQADHSQTVAEQQIEIDDLKKENLRLNRIIKDDMVPKAQAVPQPQAVGNLVPKVVPVTTQPTTHAITAPMPAVTTEKPVTSTISGTVTATPVKDTKTT